MGVHSLWNKLIFEQIQIFKIERKENSVLLDQINWLKIRD